MENVQTTLPVKPCPELSPPARYLTREEVAIFEEVVGEHIETMGQAAIVLYSNPQYQTATYERYVKRQIQRLWVRIQTNILICQGLIAI